MHTFIIYYVRPFIVSSQPLLMSQHLVYARVCGRGGEHKVLGPQVFRLTLSSAYAAIVVSFLVLNQELRTTHSHFSCFRLHSDTDSSCSEDQKPPLPEKQKKTPKKVTFENVEADKVDADTGPQQARKAEDGYSIPPATAGVWQEADMNGCDVDLCELLSSVSMEVPEVEPPKRSSEDLEAAHSAQRLSAYDNLSYKEKLAFVLNHRQGREDVEDGDRNMFLDKPSTHRVFESEAKCRMCGLFGARRTASHADDSYAKNWDTEVTVTSLMRQSVSCIVVSYELYARSPKGYHNAGLVTQYCTFAVHSRKIRIHLRLSTINIAKTRYYTPRCIHYERISLIQ